jgi:hypothetical protein
MKGLLVGGMWDKENVEVAEIPPEYVVIGVPPIAYRLARERVEEGEPVAIYEAPRTRSKR